MLHIESSSPNAGNISFTNEYIVIQGKHYNLRDWYIKKDVNNVAIRTQDILSIDFIKMRSKRLLMIFIILAFVMITFGKQLIRHSEFVFALLVIGCLVVFLSYFFRTYRFMRITSAGCIVALETKYYHINQLEYLISSWNYLRYGNK